MKQDTSTRDRVKAGLAKAVAVVGALAVVSVLTFTASRAAFTDTTDNSGNTWESGTVVLDDDDAGSVLFDVPAMAPDDSVVKCINVVYTGSLTADVKLYGTVGGTGLADYLTTTIEVGSGAAGGNTGSCAGFTGGSSIFNDTLSAFGATHTSFADGAGGFTGAVDPTTRSYRITTTLVDDPNAQAKTATASFTWEAQNT